MRKYRTAEEQNVFLWRELASKTFSDKIDFISKGVEMINVFPPEFPIPSHNSAATYRDIMLPSHSQ